MEGNSVLGNTVMNICVLIKK